MDELSVIGGYFYSFIMYGLLILTVVVLSYVVEIYKNKNKFLITKILSLAIILLPCLFAALRADTVGTDIRVYAKPVFDDILRTRSIVSTSSRYDMEVGYVGLAYFCSLVSSSISLFLFATELFIVVPIYLVAYKRSNNCPIWFTMLVFMLIFYCATFNIMRQSIAAAFLLLAYQFYEEKNKSIKIIASVIIALLFHNSTIIGLILYLIPMFLSKVKDSKKRLCIIYVGVFATVLFSLNWIKIIEFAIESRILSDKFSFYTDAFENSFRSKSSLFILTTGNYFELAFRIWFVIMACFLAIFIKDSANTSNMKFYKYELIISEIIFTAVFIFGHSSYGIRINWFGEWIMLLLFPQLTFVKNQNAVKARALTNNLLIVFVTMVAYFLLGYIIIGWHGVKPLSFRI